MWCRYSLPKISVHCAQRRESTGLSSSIFPNERCTDGLEVFFTIWWGLGQNVVIIALKQMLLDFVVFMSLALLCFSGIFFALTFLGAETWSKKVRSFLSLCVSARRLTVPGGGFAEHRLAHGSDLVWVVLPFVPIVGFLPPSLWAYAFGAFILSDVSHRV